ncbi:MAG: class I SAM-dependent methyltransferase [Woeseiaceae bacterium]|nr:class I SAM-dependent methyltransferase [Woeseiaceae bacterium]
MRKLLNRLLVKFGLLLTKPPSFLTSKTIETSSSLPANLTEKVTVSSATAVPDNELYRVFCNVKDVWKWRHYFDIYTRYFERFRERPITMLEIGVFRGGSLHMWKQYFHPESTIVGVDIDASCQAYEDAQQKVFVRIGSQADPAFLAAINGEFGPFDVILDDGSHKTHHQIISFGALFREALKDGGCYMVEDVHSNYWLKLVDSPETFVELAKHMVDLIHEPYIDRQETEFRKGHPDMLEEIQLSYLSANLDSVAFHDSIVVLDKKRRSVPMNELR